MENGQMLTLRKTELAPYIQLATALIGKPRRSGGNMFRHQMDTLGVLIDYGYVDPILLKASVIHDLLEDIPELDTSQILALDDGTAVLELVREVTRQPDESKDGFLQRIRERGSTKAKLLKLADRISNLIALGLVTDRAFIKRTCLETAMLVYPMAVEVNQDMAREIRDLLSSRLDLLGRSGLCDEEAWDV
jgi:GTP pyrophosphokinase